MLTRLEGLVHKRDQAQTHEEWETLSKNIDSLEKTAANLIDKRRKIDVTPSNGEGYNAFLLCAKIGSKSLKDKVSDCYEANFVEGLRASSIVTIKGISYTCCDLALERLLFLTERRKAENDSVMLKNLDEEIEKLKSFLKKENFLTGGPENKNNCPFHRLAEIGDPELLEVMAPKSSDLDSEVNRQNGQGETALIVSLKKLHELIQMMPSAENEIDRQKIESEIASQKKIMHYFLDCIVSSVYPSLDVKRVTGVNLQDNNGDSALHLCVSIGDPNLVKQILYHPNFKPATLSLQGSHRGDVYKSGTPFSMALSYRQSNIDLLEQLRSLRSEIGEEDVSLEREPLELETFLRPQIDTQEEIARILLNKAIKAGDPEQVENLFQTEGTPIDSSQLDFLQKEPPLKVAIEQLRETWISIQEEQSFIKVMPSYSNERLDELKKQLESQKKVIKIVIKYYAKGNEQYIPLFDALRLRDLEIIKALLESKDVDINATEVEKITPLFEALGYLSYLKQHQRTLRSQLPNAPDQPDTKYTFYKKRTKTEVNEALAQLEIEIDNQDKIIWSIRNKKPVYNEMLLHSCAEIGDTYLLDQILQVEGVNVDCLLPDVQAPFRRKALESLAHLTEIKNKTSEIELEIWKLQTMVVFKQDYRTPLRRVLESLTQLIEVKDKTDEIVSEIGKLKEVVRMLHNKGANPSLLNEEENTLLESILVEGK